MYIHCLMYNRSNIFIKIKLNITVGHLGNSSEIQSSVLLVLIFININNKYIWIIGLSRSSIRKHNQYLILCTNYIFLKNKFQTAQKENLNIMLTLNI
jgi:hypothetical protein